jgi:hypothetical protein
MDDWPAERAPRDGRNGLCAEQDCAAQDGPPDRTDRRDLVKLEEASDEQGGHAFHVIDAYVEWFESGGKNEEENKKGQRALAVLRLLGLFDRPATADCRVALQKAPAIPDLTEALVGISEPQRNVVFTRLEAAKLLTVNRDAAGALVSLDAHPLLR